MSQKAVFLDRDDTVINDPGYITEPEQVTLLPGVAEAVTQLKRMGYRVVIITNQSAIARGMLTEEKLAKIHQRLRNLLFAEGAGIDGLYYCPYHPDGTIEEFARESELRKPRPGMLLQAAGELDIDLSQSWMIGDRYRDIQAGKAAGCHTILVDVPGKPREENVTGPEPDRKAVNLREAVNIIRMYEFHQKARTAQKEADAESEHTEPAVKEPPQEAPAPLKTKPADVPVVPEPMPEPLKPDILSMETQQEHPRSAGVKVHTAKPVPKPQTPLPDEPTDGTHHLLQEILQRLKSSGRSELYDDFSVHKLLAGMAQVLALGCIVFSLWFWLSPKVGSDTVLIMIGYAVALQLLVVSLLMMHRRD
jgi:D,D-heptose 1,7-bisphosphate phosphatase